VEFIPPEKLCIENLEYMPFHRQMPLVEKYNTKICMDVGHIKLRNEDIGDFVKRYGPKLGHVHMHDVTYRLFDKRVRVMDDHQELGVGVIDVEEVLRMLHAAHFTGAVALEIHTVDPIESVRMLRKMVDDVEAKGRKREER
jgi:sugar phosphate isomerase/epimerase